jgi:carboxyl-terminal processing protease
LAQFTENAGRHVADALRDLKSKNANIKGLIFDLRGNPGGLLREAVNVSNVFVPKGELIVSTRGKVKDWDRTFSTTNQPVDTLLPLVVLIDRSSASASEIIAGVVQDLDRGAVIGERSFGKGLVQSTRDLSYKTKLKITTAKYYTPSGRCIQAINYADRNEDGSVGKTPDSLKTAFKTRSGRTVYDGGGIEPDITMELPTYAQITVALLRNNHIFHYATQYQSQRDSIEDAMDFRFTDQEFGEFVTWLGDKEYEYGTASEDLLEELVETATLEHYLDAIGEDIEALHDKLHADKEKDLEKFQEEIREELEQEIVTRYHFQTGSIENSFYKDVLIQRANSLFDDPVAYQALMQP